MPTLMMFAQKDVVGNMKKTTRSLENEKRYSATADKGHWRNNVEYAGD